MEKGIAQYSISSDITIKEALKKIGDVGERILFVADDTRRLLGTVTDGDVRRWILKEGTLNERVEKIYNRTPTYVSEGYDAVWVKRMMLKTKIAVLPVVDTGNRLINVLFWSDIFSEEFNPEVQRLRIPILVMAGGKGERLDPFTKILPKPLVPVGEKPIVEHILKQFSKYGCDEFYMTVNYKGKMIQSYFDNADSDYKIKYIWEDKPLGTAGGIGLACKIIDAPQFFVSNCDIVIKADYADILRHHEENDNMVTIVGSMKHFTIPYGVLAVKNGGVLEEISEKPEYDYLVSTGLYLIHRNIAELIPPGVKFDFTDLITKVKTFGGKVGVYPISQHSWADVGQWKEYRKLMDSSCLSDEN